MPEMGQNKTSLRIRFDKLEKSCQISQALFIFKNVLVI